MYLKTFLYAINSHMYMNLLILNQNTNLALVVVVSSSTFISIPCLKLKVYLGLQQNLFFVLKIIKLKMFLVNVVVLRRDLLISVVVVQYSCCLNKDGRFNQHLSYNDKTKSKRKIIGATMMKEYGKNDDSFKSYMLVQGKQIHHFVR